MAKPNPRQIDALPAVNAAQLLKLIDLTIAEILMKGQAVTGDGRTLTRADIDALRRMRSDIAVQVDVELPAASPCTSTMGGVLIPRHPNDA